MEAVTSHTSIQVTKLLITAQIAETVWLLAALILLNIINVFRITVCVFIFLGNGWLTKGSIAISTCLDHFINHDVFEVLDLLVLFGKLLQDFKFLLFLSALVIDNGLGVLFNDLDLTSDFEIEVIN